ncbi:MAG TPA: L17 family ribosomal protein [Candidatus Dojkabacteria bacterium]|nr:L17 family ribosomal protein [Candidatus Dojkabacteria bacterium]
MRKRNSIAKLGRTTSHRKALISNQLSTLFTYGKLETTTVKAKVMRSKAEELMSAVKKYADDKVSQTRILNQKLLDRKARINCAEFVAKSDLKVSIVKVGFRKGDNTEKSEVVLVGFDKIFVKKSKETSAKQKTTKDKKVEEVKAESKEKNGIVEEEKKAHKTENKEKKGIAEKLSQTFTKAFSGRERVRTRSGL